MKSFHYSFVQQHVGKSRRENVSEHFLHPRLPKSRTQNASKCFTTVLKSKFCLCCSFLEKFPSCEIEFSQNVSKHEKIENEKLIVKPGHFVGYTSEMDFFNHFSGRWES